MALDQPFAGITVVEFGQFVAVPFCAQLLSLEALLDSTRSPERQDPDPCRDRPGRLVDRRRDDLPSLRVG